MNKTYQQMVGSFLSIFILGLVIITPYWISNELKEVETAKESLISRNEVVSESNTTTAYQPYKEYSGSTVIPYGNPGVDTPNVCYYRSGTTYYAGEPYLSYNVNGYYETFVTGVEEASTFRLYFSFWGFASDMLDDGVDDLTIRYDTGNNSFKVPLVYLTALDGSQNMVEYESIYSNSNSYVIG